MNELPPNRPLGPPEFINGSQILGYPWGWVVDKDRIRLAKFPGEPLVTLIKFDTYKLAREAALALGPIQETDESEYGHPQAP
jgi:hypothetical protein